MILSQHKKFDLTPSAHWRELKVCRRLKSWSKYLGCRSRSVGNESLGGGGNSEAASSLFLFGLVAPIEIKIS